MAVRGNPSALPISTLPSLSLGQQLLPNSYLGAWFQAFQLLRLTEGFVVLKLVFNFVLGKEKLQPAFVAVINISLLKWRKANKTDKNRLKVSSESKSTSFFLLSAENLIIGK